MAQLYIRFHDDQLDSFDWSIIDTETPSNIIWQTASQPDLKQLSSQHNLPVIMVIAQQNVFITEYEIPEKVSRQILASIEYQIEDRLAQETETQHFALGRQQGNRVPIVVVEQSLMFDCLTLQQNFGLKVVQIIPEMFLCPWSGHDGEISLLPSAQGLMIRYGEYQCVKCQPETLPAMLGLISRQASIEQIHCFVKDDEALQALAIEGFETIRKSISSNDINPVDRPFINFQQRQFQATSPWGKLFQAWKVVAVAAMLLLCLTLANQFINLKSQENELQSVKSQQFALIKDYVGPTVSSDSNLKKEMIKLLQQNSDSQQTVDFLYLMQAFSQAQAKFSSIDIVKIGYQQNRLSVDISSKLLNEVEALLAELATGGLEASLDRMDIKPDQVSGKFVLQGGA